MGEHRWGTTGIADPREGTRSENRPIGGVGHEIVVRHAAWRIAPSMSRVVLELDRDGDRGKYEDLVEAGSLQRGGGWWTLSLSS